MITLTTGWCSSRATHTAQHPSLPCTFTPRNSLPNYNRACLSHATTCLSHATQLAPPDVAPLQHCHHARGQQGQCSSHLTASHVTLSPSLACRDVCRQSDLRHLRAVQTDEATPPPPLLTLSHLQPPSSVISAEGILTEGTCLFQRAWLSTAHTDLNKRQEHSHAAKAANGRWRNTRGRMSLGSRVSMSSGADLHVKKSLK